ncbi:MULTISPECIES: chalcone isomerase family protein [unclassified Acinetobacter]|uniref:chalcone isomerase family protein n=1 Tax=unclassified Acinetobacter TaxID=196816 RepID=UPI001EDA017E|nr:chalcone isomerase family protein [Acinetobacter sp. SM34]MCG2609566.1 chalcone isomerase family protein [Acinetobacter sp. SM34]
MGIAFQKIAIGTTLLLGSFSSWTHAQSMTQCGSGPLLVAQKQVGVARYYAQNCTKPWKGQNMQIDFSYTQDIPEWAFKRAAFHFLKRNERESKHLTVLDRITQLYKPVKSGDLYRLSYKSETQTLTLVLNQQVLGHLQHPLAQQYFNIWLGPQPFSAKLKQQLLN